MAEKRLLGAHHTMLESLKAAPSGNSAITAQKLNENQLKYLKSGVPRTKYVIRMYTRAGPAAAPRGMHAARVRVPARVRARRRGHISHHWDSDCL